jgi:hypothetical protein
MGERSIAPLEDAWNDDRSEATDLLGLLGEDLKIILDELLMPRDSSRRALVGSWRRCLLQSRLASIKACFNQVVASGQELNHEGLI